MLKKIFLLIVTLVPMLLMSAPSNPNHLQLQALSKNSVSLSWNDNSIDETGFKIFRDDELIMITPADVTSFIDKGLISATEYDYTVKATDDFLKISLNHQHEADADITIHLQDLPANNGDWVGIYPKGSDNAWENVASWSFTNGTHNMDSAGIVTGDLILSGVSAGEYEARLFFNNTFNLESAYSFNVEDKTAVALFGAREVTPTPVEKGKLFASPNGIGDACTQNKPCSIVRAVGKLSTINNILFLKAGVYNLNNRIVFNNKSGTEAKPLIIESLDQNNKAVLTGNFDGKEIIKVYASEHIQFRNLEIRDFSGRGIRIKSASNIKVEGCVIHDNKASGISLWKSSNNTIIDNTTYNNSDGDLGNADGIQIELNKPISTSLNNEIIHNTVYNNSDDGIDVMGGFNTIVKYNIAYNNIGTHEGHGDGLGIKACGQYSIGGTIEHNIAYGNNGNGIECNNNDGEGVTIQYNTSYNNKDSGFEIQLVDARAKLSKNISSANNTPENEHGIQTENSWNIGGGVEFISTNPNDRDFLRPRKDSGYEHIGAYVKNENATIFIIGDSTVHNDSLGEMGWGSKMGEYVHANVTVVNQARSGASSKSYKVASAAHHDWQTTKEMLTRINPVYDNYLLIQFAHNDEKDDEALHTEPGVGNSFYNELKVFIEEARALGVTPVLITPVSRLFRARTHGEYPQTMKDLAIDENVLLLDLEEKSHNIFYAYESSEAIQAAFATAEYNDGTHFNENGAGIVAGWVKELICELNDPSLCSLLE